MDFSTDADELDFNVETEAATLRDFFCFEICVNGIMIEELKNFPPYPLPIQSDSLHRRKAQPA